MRMRVLKLLAVLMALAMVMPVLMVDQIALLPSNKTTDETPRDLPDTPMSLPLTQEFNLTNDYQAIWEPNNIRGSSHAVATSPNKNLIAVAGGYLSDREIHLYRWYESWKEYIHVWSSGDAVFGGDVLDVEFADINENGRLEVVAACADGRVYVFEALGLEEGVYYFDHAENKYDLVWHSGDIISRRVWSVEVFDLNKDGYEEIIAGAWDNKVYVFELAWTSDWPYCPTHEFHFELVWDSGDTITDRVSEVAAGDTDYDHRNEIIAGSYDNKVYVFEAIPCQHHEYELVWDSGNTLYEPVTSITVANDLDSDPYGEIVVACYGHGVFVFHYEYPPGEYTVMKLNQPLQPWEMGLLPSGPYTGYEADKYIDRKVFGLAGQGITEPVGIPYPWNTQLLGGASALGGPIDSLTTTFSAQETYRAQRIWQFDSGNETGEFDFVYDLDLDRWGNMFVADLSNSRIQKLSSSGEYLDSWGENGSAPGQFYFPSAVTVDRVGDVYVLDMFNHRVQKFANDGTLLGVWGGPGNGTGTYFYPQGIDVSSDGLLFIADTGNDLVQVLDAYSGEFLYQWGATGSGPGQFSDPVDIEVDEDGFVFVADYYNDRVQVFDFEGNYLYQWGVSGSGDGEFDNPGGLAIDSAGNVYVADYNNERIQKFTRSGVFITKWGSSGTGPDEFRFVRGLAIGPDGALYTGEILQNRIKKYGIEAYDLEWVIGGLGNETSQFEYPYGAAIDEFGDLYISDRENARIQKFAANGTFLLSWDIPGGALPHGIEVGIGGQIYVVDRYNHKVYIFDYVGNLQGTFGGFGAGDGLLNEPRDIAVDSLGNVYVTDTENDRIQAYDKDGNFLYNWGTSGTGPNQFDFPFGIAYDSSGLLYITDTYTHRVLIYDTDGNYVDEWVASNGWLYNIEVDHDGNLYVSNFPYRVDKYRPDGTMLERLIQSVGTPEVSAAVSFPLGLAMDMGGSLYVTDYVEHTVAKINPRFVPSNVSYAIVDWGEHEEIGGDATEDWDIRLWFPTGAPSVEKVELSLSPDLKEWVTVPVEDREFRLALFYGCVIEYNIDNALRSMDWGKIRYMNIQVKGAEYHIDGADGRISKTIESAYVVRTGFVNDTEPGDDIREVLVGMADGSILAFDAESGALVWDSEGDKPRFSLDAGIRDIVQLDGRGIMPTFEYDGIFVSDATFSGFTVTRFQGFTLGHIDNTAALDMVVTAEVSGVSRLLYLRNTGTNENPVWYYVQDFFPNYCATLGSEQVGYFASPTLVDIDQDGDMDLVLTTGTVVVNGGTHHVIDIRYFEQIAINNWVERSGYFSAPQSVADGATLLSKMSFYDMDGDGALDLTMANDTLYYFGGAGPSTPFVWGRIDSYYQGINDQIRGIDSIDKVAFSDWDKDGDIDVTLAFSYTNYSDWILAPENATLAYFENTGTPGNPVWVKRRSMYEPDFRGSPISTSLGYLEPSLVDMNNDGVEDLIGLQDAYIRSFAGTITHDSFIVATYPYIHLVEVDKRGMDDYFYGYEAYDSWSNEKKYQNWTYAIEFADTDRDGKNEVIVGSFDNNIYTFEQVANNTFRRAWRSPDLAYTYNIVLNELTLWEDVRDIIVADQDRDGKLEIIAASGWRIVVFENVEDNLYELVWHSGNQIPSIMGVSLWVARDRARVTELARGTDLDRDHHAEIIAASHEWVFVFENTGNDTYSLVWQWKHDPHVIRFLPEIYDLHVADADKDGFKEIIVVGSDGNVDPWGVVRDVFGWFLIWEVSQNATTGNPIDNSFDMVFDQQLSGQEVAAYSVDVADHDKDGKYELFLGVSPGVNIWINTGDNAYAEIALLLTEDPVSNVLSANTDGDSFYEIVVSQGQRVSVFEQNWTYPLNFHYYDNVWNSTDLPTTVTDIVIGDSNHNTHLEIIVTSAEGYVYSYEWLSNGTIEAGGSTVLASDILNDSSQGERNYIEYLSTIVLMERIRTPAKDVRWLEEV